MKFENTTKIILEETGWHEGRQIDIDTAKDMLTDRGYMIEKSFETFYTEFGDLLLTLSVLDNERTISFYLRDSFGIDYDEMVINIYPIAIGCKSLDIIGNVNHNTLLVIDEKSTIYMLYDGTAKIIGKDPIEAIENLCTKDWRWFDQFEYPWKERWNGLKCDFKSVRAKEIENHKKFISKYGDII